MIIEVLASLLLGGLAIGLVLEPLVARSRRRSTTVLDQPDPEETPRGIALSALREIEFDRNTGKLSDADYAMLKERYTSIAIQAGREEPAPAPAVTDPVESIIAAKVRAIRSAASADPGGSLACPGCGPRPEPDALFCSTCGKRLPTGQACGGCGAPLAPDGKFCESCGRKVAA